MSTHRCTLASPLTRRRLLLAGGGLPALPRWSRAQDDTAGRVTVQPAALQAAAARTLADWLDARVARHEVDTVAGQPAAVEVAAGPLQLTGRAPADGTPPSGKLAVWVDVRANGRLQRSVAVPMQVRSFAMRWVARADLPAGSAVAAGDFEHREVELHTWAAPGSPDEGMAWRLRRRLQAGQLLAAADLVRRPPVQRGESVTVQHRQGAIEVRAAAQALQDGAIGQRVLVRIGHGSAPVWALVIDDRMVVME